MENYRNLNELRPGTLLAEDIFANTASPIVRKGTILEIDHLEVLDLFGIKRVKVEERIVNRAKTDLRDVGNSATIASDIDQLLENRVSRTSDLHTLYKKAVNEYKREFTSWRSGVKVDIAKVRLLIMPLLETYMEHKKMLVLLNEYSNRKEYIYHHAVSVGMLATALAGELGFPKGTTIQIGLAGTLADSGMAKINPSLLEKAAFLTKEEFLEVKKHPVFSYQMMQDSPLLRQEMKLAVLQHPERLDGSGYPRGDKDEKISLLAQVLAVADVFHAMTCERVYREKESPYRVAEMLREEGFGKFDSTILDALYALIGMPNIGDKVLLTNGTLGKVVSVQHNAPLRPTVKLKNVEGLLDLSTTHSISIEKVLD